ncbi:MAG: pantoate--beta-alanine ligase [Bacillota bacterium]|nr:pantoate--beta-alanine ligase [Bacillota bacterium]
MKVVQTIQEMRSWWETETSKGASIGLVPTMGYLHAGHLSLVAKSKQAMDRTVVSIFVNPTQFGPNEDFATYPRDLERDLKLCEEGGVDLVFAPNVEEMYPNGSNSRIIVGGDLTKKLEGATRPTHFEGVTTVVGKLFHIVRPHQAFFGQKDAQQVAVLEAMVRDLNFPVEIVPCPIVRESDGLAMSSRNTYLSPEERVSARSLSQAIFTAQKRIEAQCGKPLATEPLIVEMRDIIERAGGRIDYVRIVDPKTLDPIREIEGPYLILLAVYIGKTRLIDNVRG